MLWTPSAFVCSGKTLYLFYFWKTALLSIEFLVDIFFFQYFEYIISFSPSLKTFCWEICWCLMGGSLVCYLSILSCCIPSSLTFDDLMIMSQGSPIWGQPLWGLLGLTDWMSVSPGLASFPPVLLYIYHLSFSLYFSPLKFH